MSICPYYVSNLTSAVCWGDFHVNTLENGIILLAAGVIFLGLMSFIMKESSKDDKKESCPTCGRDYE